MAGKRGNPAKGAKPEAAEGSAAEEAAESPSFEKQEAAKGAKPEKKGAKMRRGMY